MYCSYEHARLSTRIQKPARLRERSGACAHPRRPSVIISVPRPGRLGTGTGLRFAARLEPVSFLNLLLPLALKILTVRWSGRIALMSTRYSKTAIVDSRCSIFNTPREENDYTPYCEAAAQDQVRPAVGSRADQAFRLCPKGLCERRPGQSWARPQPRARTRSSPPRETAETRGHDRRPPRTPPPAARQPALPP